MISYVERTYIVHNMYKCNIKLNFYMEIISLGTVPFEGRVNEQLDVVYL